MIAFEIFIDLALIIIGFFLSISMPIFVNGR